MRAKISAVGNWAGFECNGDFATVTLDVLLPLGLCHSTRSSTDDIVKLSVAGSVPSSGLRPCPQRFGIASSSGGTSRFHLEQRKIELALRVGHRGHGWVEVACIWNRAPRWVCL